MSKLSIDIKNLTHSLTNQKKNLVVLFYLGFFVLLAFEFFVVKTSVNQVLDSNLVQTPSRSVQKVRINFTDFNANKKRLEDAQNFQPDISPPQDPFKSK